ncbi:hypothetical protein GCM10017752_42990 [Streptomyces roseoviridis]
MKTCHQPSVAIADGERSEEISSPTVGISQNSPTSTSSTRTAPDAARAAIRAATPGAVGPEAAPGAGRVAALDGVRDVVPGVVREAGRLIGGSPFGYGGRGGC